MLNSSPQTPKTGRGCEQILLSLSIKYNLDLPIAEQRTPAKQPRTIAEKCVSGLTYLHFNGRSERVVQDFEDWAKPVLSDWIHKPNQERGTLPAPPLKSLSTSFIQRSVIECSKNISTDQRKQLLVYLLKLIEDEVWILKDTIVVSNSSIPFPASIDGLDCPRTQRPNTPFNEADNENGNDDSPSSSPSKRKTAMNKQEVFFTAPSSPTSSTPSLTNDDHGLDLLLPVISTDVSGDNQYSMQRGKQQKVTKYFSSPQNSFIHVANNSFSKNLYPSFVKHGQQPSVSNYMKVSKPSQSNARNAKDDQVKTFSTITTGLDGASFEPEPTTAATSFASDFYMNSNQLPRKSFYQFEDDEASESSTVALLQSEEFQQQFSMQLSPSQTAPAPDAVPDSAAIKVQNFVDELEASGPFAYSRCGKWPGSIPLRYRYEVERIAHAQGSYIEDILPHYQLPSQDYAEFWEYATREVSKGNQLEKAKSSIWEAAAGNFEDNGTNDVVTLTGELEWCKKSEPGYLKVTLSPLRLERSHRFARRFGSDRFLEITFPTLGKSPEYLKNQGPTVLQSIATWLAQAPHYILGRTWRAFYLEDIKPKGNAKKGGPRSKVHLFAVDGCDFSGRIERLLYASLPGEVSEKHTPMSVEAMFNWHMPIQSNNHQKDCKLFQRLSLGLSRTIPTVTLQPNQIIRLEDTEPVMNDGCALMSPRLAILIKEMLGLQDENPSCFQGRIAGAKGIWMVDSPASTLHSNDDIWIQISDSQRKIFPHPAGSNVYDDHQRTFEVVSWSRPLRPVNLNVQLLMVLQHGGVHRDRLRELIRREVDDWYNEFKRILPSGVASRAWVQRQGPSDKRKTRRVEDFPTESSEQAILLLDSGFQPFKLPFLMELLTMFLKDYCTLLDSLKIKIPESTYAYCIADPYQTLEEDEVHFGFSKPWESSGYTDLDGLEVLLGRNPAHLPTDIQKRKVAFKKELRHFKDIIVFPTKGKIPLAGMLSGGDYDGDQVWVCWDQQFVDAFTNTTFDPEDVPPPKEFGLIDHSEKLKDPFNFDKFLTKVFIFNATPSLLGHCTNEHEKLCYYENSIASYGALRLSHLLGHLADVRKTGYELKRDTWMKEWGRVSGRIGPNAQRKPAYKQTGADIDGYYQPQNVIDFLKFEIVKGETERILTDFDRFCKANREIRKDTDLAALWNEIWDRAISERDVAHDHTLLNNILKIKSEVETACKDRPSRNCGKPYSAIIAITADLLQKIEPPEFEHSLSYTWKNWGSSWQAFLASCAYALRPDSHFPWLAAGPTLCKMKAEAVGQYRMVTMPIYQTYRINPRAAKKVQEAAEGGNEAMETLLSQLVEDDAYLDALGEEGVDDDFDDWKSFAS
ncbi:hypothetical protein LOZ36_005572 [Ophidiomyces ophidiicola]|nr:hypothetical protein LOZ36_005572 [Ophidiomyces ophidiicola]